MILCFMSPEEQEKINKWVLKRLKENILLPDPISIHELLPLYDLDKWEIIEVLDSPIFAPIIIFKFKKLYPALLEHLRKFVPRICTIRIEPLYED